MGKMGFNDIAHFLFGTAVLLQKARTTLQNMFFGGAASKPPRRHSF